MNFFSKNYFLILFLSLTTLAENQALANEIPACTCGIQIGSATKSGYLTMNSQYTFKVLPDLSACYQAECLNQSVATGYIYAVENRLISTEDDLIPMEKERDFTESMTYEKLKGSYGLGRKQNCHSTWDTKKEMYFVANPNFKIISPHDDSKAGNTCALLIEKETALKEPR